MGKVGATGKVLYMEVATLIETAIMRGEWTPGQRLPALAELAAHFGVSRAVIREACSLLVGSGLLELRHGDGTYVKSFSQDAFLRPVHAALLLGSSQARAMLEIAEWLEQGILREAAKKRSDAHSTRLAEALFALEVGLGDPEAMVVAECAFHMVLTEGTSNEVAINLMRILYQPLSGVLRVLLQDEAVQDLLISVHRALYDSIVRMDEQAAVRLTMMYRQSLQEYSQSFRDIRLNGTGGA